jgi:hypothetical protein
VKTILAIQSILTSENAFAYAKSDKKRHDFAEKPIKQCKFHYFDYLYDFSPHFLHCSRFVGQSRSYLFNKKFLKNFSLKVRAHFVKLSK